MRAKMICTHNPQDFFEGCEPEELAPILVTSHMSELGFKAFRALEDGYTLIIVKDEDDVRADYICKA